MWPEGSIVTFSAEGGAFRWAPSAIRRSLPSDRAITIFPALVAAVTYVAAAAGDGNANAPARAIHPATWRARSN